MRVSPRRGGAGSRSTFAGLSAITKYHRVSFDQSDWRSLDPACTKRLFVGYKFRLPPRSYLPIGQSVAGTSRRRNAGMCCCQTSPHLRFLTHYGEQQLRWIRPCRRPITQVYWVLLTGSATSFQGTSVCPFVGQIPCSFVAASESTKGKGTLGRRFLPVTGLLSPFFWTPCGPSGFGFTEQSSKGSSICPVRYSLPTTIRSIGALCAGALSDFTTVPTGKRGASLCFLTLSKGGSGENRTHGRLSTHGGFQDRCLRPLGHASLS